MVSILKQVYQIESWNNFLIYLESKEDFLNKPLIREVKKIIKAGVEKIDLDFFPLPTKKEIQKYKTSRKRIVYLYPEPYNTYLKMINWLLQEDEDYSKRFCINSYAYQKNKSVHNGVVRLNDEIHRKTRKFYIKSDFSDYFNSIKLDILKTKMDDFFKKEDRDLIDLLVRILDEPLVYVNNRMVEIQQKGVMAGIAISGYLANIYMNDVDWEMYKKRIYYIRYADDIFIMTNNAERDLNIFQELIKPLQVNLNPLKTQTGAVKNGFTVLGFQFINGIIDIDEAKVQKMFDRIRRRSRWFLRWEKEKNVKKETMVRTFINGMNEKLYANDDEDRLNWTKWYFANINTTANLERIDSYLIQYIRYLISEKHLGYKKHAEVEYDYIKKLGYKNLVNEYWKYKKKGGKEHAICN